MAFNLKEINPISGPMWGPIAKRAMEDRCKQMEEWLGANMKNTIKITREDLRYLQNGLQRLAIALWHEANGVNKACDHLAPRYYNEVQALLKKLQKV